jgi:hypothetical protein
MKQHIIMNKKENSGIGEIDYNKNAAIKSKKTVTPATNPSLVRQKPVKRQTMNSVSKSSVKPAKNAESPKRDNKVELSSLEMSGSPKGKKQIVEKEPELS